MINLTKVNKFINSIVTLTLFINENNRVVVGYTSEKFLLKVEFYIQSD